MREYRSCTEGPVPFGRNECTEAVYEGRGNVANECTVAVHEGRVSGTGAIAEWPDWNRTSVN